MCRSLAAIEYHELSLIKLIVSTRTRNWLEKARARLDAEDFAGAIEACAVALEIFRSAHMPANRTLDLEGQLRRRMQARNAPEVLDELHDILRTIQAQFEDIRSQLDIVSAGLEADATRRFSDLTPIVHLSAARTVHVGHKRYGAKVDHESALFCLSYVVEAALKMQHAYRPDPHAQIPLTRRLRVTTPTSVIVYPEDKSKEAIASLEVGDLLIGYYEKYDMPGYVAVFYENDRAYVPLNCIERADSHAGQETM